MHLIRNLTATRYFTTRLLSRCANGFSFPRVTNQLCRRQFSQQVIDHLQESTGSPSTSPERQSTLDAHIRARINAELGRLREEERVVREQIEAALEKENLTKERTVTDSDETEGGVNSSSSVQGALDEVQKRVDRFHAKRDLGGYLLVSESSQKLIECYR